MVEAEWLAEALGGCEPGAMVRGRVEVLGCAVDDWEPVLAGRPWAPEIDLVVGERDLGRPDVLAALGRLVAAVDSGESRRWRNDPTAGPYDVARERGLALGVCPVGLLEDFYTDHWDVEQLCAAFGCAECVSTPDYELYGPDYGPHWGPGYPSPPCDDWEDDDVPF